MFRESCWTLTYPWFFIIDGCSLNYAHTWSKSGLSICWRHLVTSKESSNPFFFGKRPCLHHTCATLNEQPSNIKTMIFRNVEVIERKGRTDLGRRLKNVMLLTAAFGAVHQVLQNTVCPRSSDQFHIEIYYRKWATTSWAFSIYSFQINCRAYLHKNYVLGAIFIKGDCI